MALSIRPGSLTLLAGVNFVGAGLSLIICLVSAIHLSLPSHGSSHHGPPLLPDGPLWLAWLSAGWSGLRSALLLISGFGLRRQSPLWGRWVANLYAVLAITMAVVWMMNLPDPGAGVMIGLLAAFHPLVLLVWINVVVHDVWKPVALKRALATSGGGANAGHVRLNLLLSLRQTLRGAAGPAFLLGYVASGLMVVLVVVYLAGMAERVNGRFLGNGKPAPVPGVLVETATRWVLRTVLHEEPATAMQGEPSSAVWARHLTQDHVALTSFTWLMFSVLAGLWAAGASFNLISRDAAQHGFRFLLVRTSRTTIYLGRFLAAALLAAGATLVLVTIATVALGLVQPGINWSAHLAWSAWAAAALILTTLPYVALGLWFSTLLDTGLLVLALVNAVVIGVPILALVLSAEIWEPLIYLIHVVPAALQFWLFHPSPWSIAGAAAACLAYTALYLYLGLRSFQTKDL